MGKPARSTITKIVILLFVTFTGASAQDAPVSAPRPSTLAGVVRDSAGSPITDAQVLVSETGQSVRTNDRGEYTLAAAPGRYQIWFRHLGYASVGYNWLAKIDDRTEVNVRLAHIAKQLDPVIVQAEEDKRIKARSSILGVVLDTAGAPVDEANVELIGANVGGMSRENGGFLFKPLAVGTYVIRVRKIGYEPVLTTVQLVESDERDVIVRMKPLPTSLDPVVVTAQSGYDARDDKIWQELEWRKRFVDSQVRIMGPEDLRGQYGANLAQVAISIGANVPRNSPRGPRSINPRATSSAQQAPSATMADACILINGKDPFRGPLSSLSSADLEMLEYWPPGRELTMTLSDHFPGSMPQCKGEGVSPPAYWVAWYKGHS